MYVSLVRRWMLVVAIPALPALPASAQARAHRLNGDLGLETWQDVRSLELSAEGHVVFEAGPLSAGSVALYSALPDGSSRTLLADTAGTGSSFVTPDGVNVVFRDDAYRLLIARIDGSSAPRVVAGSFYSDERVQVSADSGWAVYLSQVYDSYSEETYVYLYSARLEGAAAWQRIDGLGVTAVVYAPEISPDSSRVVYAAVSNALYSRPIDGSRPPVLLSSTWWDAFRITPDGQTVLFRAGAARELFAIPIDGGTPVLVGPPGVQAALSTDTHVEGGFVYFRTFDGTTTALWKGRIDGSAPPVRLDPTPTLSGIGAFLVLPGAAHVLCVTSIGGAQHLVRLPTDGSQAVVDVSGAPAPGGFVRQFELTAAGQRVVFRGEFAVSGRTELFAAPTDGSASRVRLGDAMGPDADVQDAFELTPDGLGVVYRADLLEDEHVELFGASTAGPGPSFRLSAPVFHRGDVIEHRVGPGGQRVFYRADQDEDEVFELFGVHLAAPGAAYRLNGPFTYRTSGAVRSFHPSPDGEHLLFDAQLLGSPVVDLHSISLRDYRTSSLTRSEIEVGYTTPTSGVLGFARGGRDIVYGAAEWAPFTTSGIYVSPAIGGLAPLLLDATPNFAYQLAPDGEWLVGRDYIDTRTFRSVRTDGSGEAHALGSFGLYVGGVWEVSPGSDHLVYVDGSSSASLELFSVRIDGSAPSVPISGPLVTGGGVRREPLTFSPDGLWVLYVADAEVDGQDELYRTAVDGSSPVVRLNGTMAAGGDVFPYTARITPDGSRVAYVADQSFDGLQDLYSVPLDRSSGPLRISRFAVNGQVSPDDLVVTDQRAVFLGDKGGAGHLFSVPLDDSTDPVPLFAEGGIDAFAVTPDGQRVVFEGGFGRDRLFAVPVDGSAAAVELSQTLGASARVLSFQLAPNGRRVAFRTDAHAMQLAWVPIEGGTARSLFPDPPASAGVAEYGFTADGNRVIYRADARENGVLEHFESFLVPPHRPR
jgi:hypothetical protein